MNEKPTTAKDAEMTVLKALGNYLAQDSCLTPKDKQKSTISSGELSGDKLGDFAEGQWWLTELDAAVANGTNDQKRAVAVVRNLLRTAQAALEAAPAGEVVVTKNEAGQIVAVTRQDEDHRILSVIAMSGPMLTIGDTTPEMYGSDDNERRKAVEAMKNLFRGADQKPAAAAQEHATLLPDGSAFAVVSYPLPKTHWLYAPREYEDGADEPKELPAPILTHAQRDSAIAAIRYAVRGATMCGKVMDFDPDALVQNAVYALCGPYARAEAVPETSHGIGEAAE